MCSVVEREWPRVRLLNLNSEWATEIKDWKSALIALGIYTIVLQAIMSVFPEGRKHPKKEWKLPQLVKGMDQT